MFSESQQGRLTPELEALDAALRHVPPVPSRLDRDRLMFQAGAAACGRSLRWGWPMATAAMTLVASGLALWIVMGPDRPVPSLDTPTQSSRQPGSFVTQTGERSTDPPVARLLDPSSHFAVRRLVLTGGVEALPDLPAHEYGQIPTTEPLRRWSLE